MRLNLSPTYLYNRFRNFRKAVSCVLIPTDYIIVITKIRSEPFFNAIITVKLQITI